MTGYLRSSLIAATALLSSATQPAFAAPASFDEEHKFEIDVKVLPGRDYEVKWSARVLGSARNEKVDKYDKPKTVKGQAPLMDQIDGEAEVEDPDAKAESLSKFDVKAPAPGTTIAKGEHRVMGMASADKGATAFSKATSKVEYRVQTADAKGKIKWDPHWSVVSSLEGDSVGGSKDPIDFSVENLDTGEILQSRLFEIDVQVFDGAFASWTDGLVEVDGSVGSGSLLVDMTSPFITSAQGSLFVSFLDGLIVESLDSGLFDGLLPGVGSSALFNFTIADSDGFEIAFDFGSANTNGYDFTIDLEASGEAAVPEPPIAFLLGVGLAILSLSRRNRQRE